MKRTNTNTTWIALLVLLAGTAIANAQQLYVEGGKTLSSFDYTDSNGDGLESMQGTSQTYMALGYRTPVWGKALHFSLGAGYRGHGATGSDTDVPGAMQWDLSYAEVDAGLDLNLFKVKKAVVHLRTELSTGILVQGTQLLGSSVIDLKDNDDFGRVPLTLRAGIGLVHPVSEHLSLYVRYMYGSSGDVAKGGEQLRLVGGNAGFGLLVDIGRKTAAGEVPSEADTKDK